MADFVVHGDQHLSGSIYVQGSKNAVLPMLAATLLNRGNTKIYGCPKIEDVYAMLEILKTFHCDIVWQDAFLEINTECAVWVPVSRKIAEKFRASICMMGAVLGRFGEVHLPMPGGCAIGKRPIDLHLFAMKCLNSEQIVEKDYLILKTTGLMGSDIHLKIPSVGVTENILLAAVLAKGTTRIYNAAKEPEIIDLCIFLNKMGAMIHGMGTSCITIYGTKKLNDVSYHVMSDRIVAATYLAGAALTKGDVCIKNVWEHDIKKVLQMFVLLGCGVIVKSKSVRVIGPESMLAIDQIHTGPFPQFPTDMQSQFIVLLTLAKGNSRIYEHIFENRFHIVPELVRMGADIEVKNHYASIRGVNRLIGNHVAAKDLRGCAALILAAMVADGMTIIENAELIQRGHEDILRDLRQLGYVD